MWIFILVILGGYAHAHPVIYKSGTVYQGTFMPQMNISKVGYSFHPNFAFVAKSQSFENMNNYRDYTFGFNALLKRWLQHDSQGNIYAGVHGGHYKDFFDEGATGHVYLMADWEDREDYVVFKTKTLYYNDETAQSYMFRYGFAPYVAGMNELQSWLIVQAFYLKEQSRQVLLTPMIRFFYKNVLWETGSSTKGDFFLTLMVHY
jgi:hypothetical protein